MSKYTLVAVAFLMGKKLFVLDNSFQEYACSRVLFEGTYTNTNGIYEGWLLWHDSKPRRTKVLVRDTDGDGVDSSHSEVKAGLDLMLIDLTGPIMTTLWGGLDLQRTPGPPRPAKVDSRTLRGPLSWGHLGSHVGLTFGISVTII